MNEQSTIRRPSIKGVRAAAPAGEGDGAAAPGDSARSDSLDAFWRQYESAFGAVTDMVKVAASRGVIDAAMLRALTEAFAAMEEVGNQWNRMNNIESGRGDVWPYGRAALA